MLQCYCSYLLLPFFKCFLLFSKENSVILGLTFYHCILSNVITLFLVNT